MRAWISLISLDSPFRVRIKTTRTHRHERQVTHYGIMRLINTHTLTLEEFIGRRIPRYAILSHTWEEEEVSYEEYIRGVHTRKKGYSKIQKTCCLAAAEGIGYAWVDTCCIDKRSSAELTEAINSMYLWYKCSAVCYAYLSDLPRNARLDKHLQKCRWFTRGWTLQELIAPCEMHFFDSGWCNFGTKRSLVDSLSAITRINSSLLQGRTPLSGFSVAQRFSWAASRQTSRTEDIAYCLFGIFELNLPLLYGEGKNAFRRLQEEIIRTILDLSIFAWQVLPLDQDDNPMSKADFDHVFVPRTGDVVLSGIFAESPAEFYPCVDYVSFPEDVLGEVSNSSKGIKIHSRLLLCAKLGFQEWDYVLPLRCKSHNRWLGIHLRQVGYQVYLRAEPRLLLQYYDRAFSTGELSTIQPQERHLLLRIPNASGYQDDRLVQSRKILSRVRSDVLHIRSPAQLSIIEPWPLANFDHQDRMFSFRNNSRHRFASAKIFGIVPHPDVTRRGTVAFSGWICAVHMQNNNTSFGIFASTLSNDRKINQVLDLLSKADYHTEQIMTLLDTCGIPMVSSAICPILGTPYVAEVTARSSETRDPSVCRNIYRQITLDYRITLGTKQLSILRKQKWIETERQMRPDAARLLVSSDSYWLPEQL